MADPTNRPHGRARIAMHEDQIDISLAVVRQIVADQFPQWAGEPLSEVGSEGTVNAIFRIGDRLAARFPLRAADPVETREMLEREARASAELAACSPFPTPVTVAIGDPAESYPLPWSVGSWLDGIVASREEASNSLTLAEDLASLVAALRQTETGGRRFQGPGRGGALKDHDEWIATCLLKSEGLLDVARLERLWGRFRALPRSSPDVMSHGDLIPGNILVAEGRLVGVLDCGGFGPADPALDVIAGWHLLDDERRAVFRAALRCDDLEWERSKAWAFQQSLGAVWYYAKSNPAMSEMGRRTLSRIATATPL